MTDLVPGMIGLTPIAGEVGKTIEFLQGLNGDGFEQWEHAFVCLPGNKIIEAEPGGARIADMNYSSVYWCEGIYDLLPQPLDLGALELTAHDLEGIQYSFLDYGALVAHRLHLWAPGLKHFIQTSKHEICSQLADDFYWRLGVQIFTDNRWPGYVTPASLYKRDLELK